MSITIKESTIGGAATSISTTTVEVFNTYNPDTTVPKDVGGAIYINGDSISLAVSESEFNDITAEAGYGGVIYIVDAADVSVETSTFLRCHAEEQGSMIWSAASSSFSL